VCGAGKSAFAAGVEVVDDQIYAPLVWQVVAAGPFFGFVESSVEKPRGKKPRARRVEGISAPRLAEMAGPLQRRVSFQGASSASDTPTFALLPCLAAMAMARKGIYDEGTRPLRIRLLRRLHLAGPSGGGACRAIVAVAAPPCTST